MGRVWLLVAMLLVGAGGGPGPERRLAQTVVEPPENQIAKLWLDARGGLHAEDARGGPVAELALDVGSSHIESGTIEVVTAEGHRVAHAKASVGEHNAAEAVVGIGAWETIYSGRTGPVGDGDREERLQVLTTGVVAYQRSPTIERCDGEDMLFPRRFDFDSHRFRSVVVAPPEGAAVAVSKKAPSGTLAAPLGLFHVVGASTNGGAGERADRLGAPTELEDGSIQTVWVAGPPGGGRGAWVTARAQTGRYRVRAVKLTFGAGPPPRRISLVLGKRPGQVFTAAIAPAQTSVYLQLPAPEPTACVSVVIAEPPSGSPHPTAIAELAILTEIDRADGLDQLARAVAGGEPGSDAAEHVLASQGVRGAAAVARQLPSAGGPGRRRLLELLVAAGEPEGAELLGRALDTSTIEERELIVAGLKRLGSRGAKTAASVYADVSRPEASRAAAAVVLGGAGKSAGETAATALLAFGATDPKSVRVAAVAALTQLARASATARQLLVGAVERVLGAPATDVARARALVLSLGRAARETTEREAAAELIQSAWRRTPADESQFGLRLALLEAMRDLAAPSLGPLLAEIVQKEPDEVLRRTAVEAAAGLADAGRRPALLSAAHDKDPAARSAAVIGIGAGASPTRDEDAQLLLFALAHDAWPLVRRAAAEALGHGCASGAAAGLLEAIRGSPASRGDPAEEVRRAALVSLDQCSEVGDPTVKNAKPGPAAAVLGVLEDVRQPVAVRELAASLVARRGGMGGAGALRATLLGVLDEGGDESSLALAVACVRGLGRVGDVSDATLKALGAASNEPLSPSLRAAAMDSIGRLCPVGAKVALARGEADPDGTVRRAASLALRRCNR